MHEPIKEIIINKVKYTIALTVLGINRERKDKLKKCEWWVCAYVILKGKIVEDYMILPNCTYNKENVYGVDTAHYYNWKMTLDEKADDAIRQIKELIKGYNRLMRK